MPDKNRLRGLYAITPSDACRPSELLPRVTAALQGGTGILQYRDKAPDRARRRANAEALKKQCQIFGALLIINDDIELASEVGADGVHIGRDDGDIENARRKLGQDAIIGISCYNQLPLAIQAQAAGADYVAFGRFFPSVTKPQAVQAYPELLTAARRALRVPVVAIGGITPENGATLIQAGADMLAVVNAVFGQQDIEAGCRRFHPLFDNPERGPQ
ncbi:MAG: thiamine phosphate synthase [Sedimenticola sp.]|nr:thiamine phosphate synthase [Sedimenticola sp.]